MAGKPRVAYLVSRFPTVTETFILRELDGLDNTGAVELEVRTLFRRGSDTVHPAARRWLPRVTRGGPLQAAGGMALWLARRPLRLLSSLGLVLAGYRREPRLLVRAVLAFCLGVGHAASLTRSRVDHVHAHFAGHPALAAWAIHRLTGIPYSITAHAYDLFLSQAFLERKVADARFVIAISDYNRRFLADHAGGAPTAVHVVHCGIDPGAYAFEPRLLPAEGPVHGVCVASLQTHKGQSFLLEALASGRPGLDRVEVALVGDGQERSRLEGQIARLGLERRVRLLGNLPEDEVARVLGEGDLFVLPSVIGADGRMEGLPVSLMEALAAGLPTVATRISGVPEIVVEGETGLLAEQSDADSLARAIESTLADPEAARERARAGRLLVEERFDVAETSLELARLFTASARHGEED